MSLYHDRNSQNVIARKIRLTSRLEHTCHSRSFIMYTNEWTICTQTHTHTHADKDTRYKSHHPLNHSNHSLWHFSILSFFLVSNKFRGWAGMKESNRMRCVLHSEKWKDHIINTLNDNWTTNRQKWKLVFGFCFFFRSFFPSFSVDRHLVHSSTHVHTHRVRELIVMD